jgi:L-alanine-DL-glutamate epimerase-like enolase superfamily enzyme
MKITKIEHWTEHLKLIKPYTIAYETYSDVVNHFVRIETDTGAFGLGAAAPEDYVTGESTVDCKNALNGCLDSLLIGQDIRHIEDLIRNLKKAIPKAPAARAAIDMALYDLMGKYHNLPLADMLGRVHRSLQTSITIGIMPTEEAVQQTDEYLRRGFRILKVKIGKAVDEDIERLHKIREKTGRQIPIRVDANQGYSLDDYRQFIKRSQHLDLEFIEQPLKADDIEGMQSMPESVRQKTAADESLLNEQNALKFTHSPRPFGIYNIKLMKCGGIFPALRIAEIALLASIELMWGCMDESIVSISAALHAALASPATRYVDLDGSLNLVRDLVAGGFRLKNGELTITDQPGLGVTLN